MRVNLLAEASGWHIVFSKVEIGHALLVVVPTVRAKIIVAAIVAGDLLHVVRVAFLGNGEEDGGCDANEKGEDAFDDKDPLG